MAFAAAEPKAEPQPAVVSYVSPVVSTYSGFPGVLPAGVPAVGPAGVPVAYPYPYNAPVYARSVYGVHPAPFYV